MCGAGKPLGFWVCYDYPAQAYPESGGRRNRLELAVERNRGKKRNKTLSISGDVLEKMRLYAELDARSLSQYINLVLKRHLAEIERQ